jgi:hypothetical protein
MGWCWLSGCRHVRRIDAPRRGVVGDGNGGRLLLRGIDRYRPDADIVSRWVNAQAAPNWGQSTFFAYRYRAVYDFLSQASGVESAVGVKRKGQIAPKQYTCWYKKEKAERMQALII